jgi:SH3 domain protein
MKTIISRNLAFKLLMALPIILVLLVQTAQADTRYVSDKLIIGMREGEGGAYNVIKYLETGTSLEVLEEGDDYLRVRTRKGEEGWVPKKYITSETPKAVVISGLNKEVARLKSLIEKAKEEKKSLMAELASRKREHSARVDELKKAVNTGEEKASISARGLEQATSKYNALVEQSGNVLELVEERDRLRAQNKRLVDGDIVLSEENRRLKRNRMLWWFLAGACVFFVGWFVGKASRQKRYY